MNNYNAAAPWHSYKADIRTVKIEKGIESIGAKAFYECEAIEAIYYSGTIEDWTEIAGKPNVPREPALYFNGELHEHSFSDDVTVREPTCLHSGLLRHLCECGDYNQEVKPSLAHTPGEWETDSAGRMVRRCTECQRIVEVQKEEPEEIPEEKPTEQPEQEEETAPEEEERSADNLLILSIIGCIGSSEKNFNRKYMYRRSTFWNKAFHKRGYFYFEID